MVEIRYGDSLEMADLAGKTVAEARETYAAELGIPTRAKARLNDESVSKKLESEAILDDNDELRFVTKSHKGLYLIGAMLLALLTTGGVFAATALTATVTATITAESDFVSVVAGGSPPSWTAYGKFTGKTGAQSEVYKATPANNFNGDFVILLTLTNVDELSEVYQVLNMRFAAGNGTFTSVTASPAVAVLSLDKPVTEIEVTAFDAGGDNVKYIDIELLGGFYKTNKDGTWTAGFEDPDIFVQIIQKGTQP